MNHFDSNEGKGQIGFHLSQIRHKFDDGQLDIDKSNEKIFKKIIQRMMKYNQGYWVKENWEYKILFYSLKGLLKSE
jgi:reverse gyrase